MNWLRKAPAPVIVTVIITVGLVVLGSLGGFVALSWAGKPTDDYRTMINTIANIVMVPLAGAGAWFSAAGAKSASKAEENSNGHLSDKDDEIRELRARVSLLSRRPPA